MKQKIEKDFKIPCYNPPNGGSITIESLAPMPVNVSVELLKDTLTSTTEDAKKKTQIEGILLMKNNEVCCNNIGRITL